MKWLRLLFLRDFEQEDCLMVWDAVFADLCTTHSLFSLVPHLAVPFLPSALLC